MKAVLDAKLTKDGADSPGPLSLPTLPATLFYHTTVKTRYDELHEDLLPAMVAVR